MENETRACEPHASLDSIFPPVHWFSSPLLELTSHLSRCDECASERIAINRTSSFAEHPRRCCPLEAIPAESRGHRESRSSDKLPRVLPLPHIVLHFRLVIPHRMRHGADDDACESTAARRFRAKSYFNRGDISISLCLWHSLSNYFRKRSGLPKAADELGNRVTSQLFIVAFILSKARGVCTPTWNFNLLLRRWIYHSMRWIFHCDRGNLTTRWLRNKRNLSPSSSAFFMRETWINCAMDALTSLIASNY